MQSAHFAARGIFSRQVSLPGHVLPALPVPVVPGLRTAAMIAPAPLVGQDDALLRP